ncbi:MAG: DUF2339 domain-containing protein [Acidobacteria bacterium]|nr:DUF2339 domain-containing protein [Acidobacteriota bacterium]
MESTLILLAIAIVVTPFIALGVAIAAFARVRALERRLARLDPGALRGAPAPEPAPRPAREPIPAGPIVARGPRPEPPLPAVPAPPAAPPLPARPGPTLEERLTRGAVWVGAVALALAGAFLVKLTFDRGLLGPAARVTLGLVFGGAMLGAGEWMRRRSARIAQALSAAGIAVVYASLLAGVSLYHLIPRGLGFGLLALNTAVAVALSLRHGVAIAVLGLAGGFVTPALIGSEEPNAPALFTYLFLLEAGLLAAARPRRWWPIAVLTLGGGIAWTIAWLALFWHRADTLTLSLFLVATFGAFAVAALARGGRVEWGSPRAARALATAAGAAAAVLIGFVAGAGGYTVREWVFVGIVAAGCLVLARLRVEQEVLAWLASAVGLVLLGAWAAAPGPPPAEFGWVALGYGSLLAAGAYAALWGSANPARWAALSAFSALAYFLVAWGVLRREQRFEAWGALALALAGAYVVAAWPVARRRAGSRAMNEALAALAVGVTFFVSAAVPLELDRFGLTVAWALEVAALAWLERTLRVPALRVLAAALGIAVLARLLLNPALVSYEFGPLPVLNWLLFGYGVPIAAFLAAAWTWRRGGLERWAELAEGAAIALGLAFIALEVRQYFHPERPLRADFELAELGAIFSLWALLAWGLLRGGARLGRRALRWGGHAAAGLAIGAGLLVLGALANPLWTPLAVGERPVLNALLLAYGLPALLALALAREYRGAGAPVGARLCATASLAFFFLLVSLEVRQAFHGGALSVGPMTNPELYSYSVAWVLFGTLLLALGIVTRGFVLRWASLAVMLLAVGKVFLFDMSELRDLYRVLSLFGLGVSLLLLAFLYQRFVFRVPQP